ncbi:hypothetical protein [Magnetospirillum gryphiswaldense]|uniref:hypothetical protein n=1 Tax=Magnetospirillum gryphiswaldense TaxID=55518 RepID=UPI000D045579|nr:hypothetical protein [Magnetospirillum gryphiswaldense]AVM73145.1 hypothetical protein MSR1_06350 [Magnetospirillum gryphiswaldense MSR-1]AVM77048.1 hypothetical protein MSR1L_06350 [Magnetospirillum gryphiswaldense]
MIDDARQLAESRVMQGKTQLGLSEIKTIAQVTKPSSGIAVVDPEATVAFVEIRFMCSQALNRP